MSVEHAHREPAAPSHVIDRRVFVRSCNDLAFDYCADPAMGQVEVRERITAICRSAAVMPADAVERLQSLVRGFPGGTYLRRALDEDLGAWLARYDEDGSLHSIDRLKTDADDPLAEFSAVTHAQARGGIGAAAVSTYAIHLQRTGFVDKAKEIIDAHRGHKSPLMVHALLVAMKQSGDASGFQRVFAESHDVIAAHPQLLVSAAKMLRSDEGGLDAAITCLEEHLDAVKSDAFALHLLASYYLQMSAPDLALELLEGCPDMLCGNERVLHCYVESLVMLGLSAQDIVFRTEAYGIRDLRHLSKTLLASHAYHSKCGDHALAMALTLPDVPRGELCIEMRLRRTRTMIDLGRIADVVSEVRIHDASPDERVAIARALLARGCAADALPYLVSAKRRRVILHPEAEALHEQCLAACGASADQAHAKMIAHQVDAGQTFRNPVAATV